MRAVIDDEQRYLAVRLAKLEAIEPESIFPAVDVPASRGNGLPFDDDPDDHGLQRLTATYRDLADANGGSRRKLSFPLQIEAPALRGACRRRNSAMDPGAFDGALC